MRWLTDRRVKSLQQQLANERGLRREAMVSLRIARDGNVKQANDHDSQILLMQNALLDEEREHAETAELLKAEREAHRDLATEFRQYRNAA